MQRRHAVGLLLELHLKWLLLYINGEGHEGAHDPKPEKGHNIEKQRTRRKQPLSSKHSWLKSIKLQKQTAQKYNVYNLVYQWVKM